MILPSGVSCYPSCKARGHLRWEREAKKRGLVECEVGGIDPRREIAQNIKRGVSAAFQACTMIIDVSLDGRP